MLQGLRQPLLRVSAAAVFAPFCLIVACSNSDDEPSGGGKSGITFADFQAQVASTAGTAATNCGTVEVNADRSAVSCCISNHYVQSLPAYAIYKEQGTDSYVSSGVAVNATKAVTNLQFDSDPMGQGRTDNGKITSTACQSPQLQPNVCSTPTGLPFQCS